MVRVNGSMPSPLTRRTVLVAGGSALVPLAGCLDGSDPSGPQHRSYTLTITRSGETLELEIRPAGEVADVIQINVGDTVEFTIVNDAGVPVGFHNHANDAELVIEPGEEHVMSFEATEAMTGRQEIEGWVIESEPDGEGHAEENGAHGDGATTLAIIEVRPGGG